MVHKGKCSAFSLILQQGKIVGSENFLFSLVVKLPLSVALCVPHVGGGEGKCAQKCQACVA